MKVLEITMGVVVPLSDEILEDRPKHFSKYIAKKVKEAIISQADEVTPDNVFKIGTLREIDENNI